MEPAVEPAITPAVESGAVSSAAPAATAPAFSASSRCMPAPSALPDRLRRMLDPAYPLVREDLVWALDHMKCKVADGAPEWTGLDRPRLLAKFAAYANLAARLLQRQSLQGEDAGQLRAMLKDMLP